MRALVLALALLAPMPALALSCMAPSVERSFARFEAEDDVYIVVHGRLTFNTKKLPKRVTHGVQPPRRTDVAARLKGSSLTKDGFTLPFDQTVTLEVTPQDGQRLALAQEAGVLSLTLRNLSEKIEDQPLESVRLSDILQELSPTPDNVASPTIRVRRAGVASDEEL